MLWISISQTIFMPDRNRTLFKSEQNNKCSWYKYFNSRAYYKLILKVHYILSSHNDEIRYSVRSIINLN